MSKIKVENEGQECRKCKYPVIRKVHKKNWKPKEYRSYYFKSWLYCKKCKTSYYSEDEKIWIKEQPKQIDRQYIPNLVKPSSYLLKEDEDFSSPEELDFYDEDNHDVPW